MHSVYCSFLRRQYALTLSGSEPITELCDILELARDAYDNFSAFVENPRFL
jgi:hypothetical protein